MPEISAGSVTLYYELHGPADAPVVVLSNGILMSTASWMHQVPALSRAWRVLLYDCRGQWRSEHPPGPYSMEMHAEDLAALLDALHIEKAHVAGISYGAELSMLFAARHPERVRSLIVSSAVSQVDPLLHAIVEEWIAAARAADPEALFRATVPMNFSEAWIAANGAALQSARQRYEELDFPALLELLLAFSGLEITGQLPSISAPTLVISGEEDILKPRKYSELITGQIPGAHLAMVPNAGHSVCWEQPVVFNALVLGFLAQV
jgi:3-oxoadipate enol-lactonase